MNKHIMALYGNVKLERGYCNKCKGMTIIKDGKYSCCDGLVYDTPAKFERVSEPFQGRRSPSLVEKNRILEKQENKCFYCGISFGSFKLRNGKSILIEVEWDHRTPFAYSRNNKTENFVAACHVCNRLKSSRIFQTVEEAQVYLAERRKSKGYNF
jgi:hypothetical protein